MEILVKDILAALETIAPARLAESWDNVGFIAGRSDQPVSTLLIGLDPTVQLFAEAVAREADLVITHHPLIFRPLSRLDFSDPVLAALKTVIDNNISVIACHTNFDSAADGVSDALARLLGLEELKPLRPDSRQVTEGCGLGRIGSYSVPGLGSADFISRVLSSLHLESAQVAGVLPDVITKVAVCGGSGSELAETARLQGADVYLSAEIKHSTACWARECGFCVIDATHYATEQPAVQLLADALEKIRIDRGWSLEIKTSQQEQPPFYTLYK